MLRAYVREDIKRDGLDEKKGAILYLDIKEDEVDVYRYLGGESKLSFVGWLANTPNNKEIQIMKEL